MTGTWRHTWPIIDDTVGFIDCCIQAMPDLHAAVHDAGHRMVGRVRFHIAEAGDGQLALVAETPVQPERTSP